MPIPKRPKSRKVASIDVKNIVKVMVTTVLPRRSLTRQT